MVSLWQPSPTRVIHARIGGTVEDDAIDVAHVAAASIAFVPAMWSREDAPERAWHFVRRHVDYIEEPPHGQKIRFPWATLAEGVADCKSTAILIAAMCAACGCAVRLRYIMQPGEADFGHVYAVADGIAVDPLVAFATELDYTCAEDIAINGPTP